MQSIIYPFEQHRIPIDQVDSDALYVMEKLRQAGHTAYLVGGSVRDLLLGRHPKDFDISTSAKPEEIKKLFRNCILIGRRFRLAHIRFGKKILEVATFRSGDNETDSLIIQDNVWGTPEQDVLRRDFTINGLFYDPNTQTIIDFVGGYEDTQKKYLRTIGPPLLRFKQDPVRMLRLLKFQGRFGLEVDPETKNALLTCHQEIIKSSPARVLEEILRMLESGASCPFFTLMMEHGFLSLLLPNLADFVEKVGLDNPTQDIYSYLKTVDAFYHNGLVKQEKTAFLDRSVLLACLIFPLLQKRLQTEYLEKEVYPHLGQVHDEIHVLLDETFNSFFLLPRRMRASIVSLLTSQYRLTPFHRKNSLKIPRDPDFPLALQFLKIRSLLQPELQAIWEEWTQVYHAQKPHLPPRKPSSRKRNRHSKSHKR